MSSSEIIEEMGNAPEFATLIELCLQGATQAFEFEDTETGYRKVFAYHYGLNEEKKLCHHIYEKGDSALLEHVYFWIMAVDGIITDETICKEIIEYLGENWEVASN